jgi:uncharacterized protein YecT (DUF1311 family)
MQRHYRFIQAVSLAAFWLWFTGWRIATAEPAGSITCDKAVSTVEMNICAERELDTADVKLNAEFKKAIAWIGKTGSGKPYDARSWEAALRASQRAWIAFRDADCKGLLPYSWAGGTGTTSAVLGCMSAKTKARTAEIKELFEPN